MLKPFLDYLMAYELYKKDVLLGRSEIILGNLHPLNFLSSHIKSCWYLKPGIGLQKIK